MCYVGYLAGTKTGLFSRGLSICFLELKLLLLLSMCDWMASLSGNSFSSLEEFLDLCNFR